MRIICLANSYKHNGRCIAGIDDAGRWVRQQSSCSMLFLLPHYEIVLRLISRPGMLHSLSKIISGCVQAI